MKKKIVKMVEINGKKRRMTLGLEIKFTEEGVFSVCGEMRCDGHEMYGQCMDSMKKFLDENGFKCAILERVMDYWPRYHLNDVNAGSPKQMEVYRELKKAGKPCDWETMCKVLKQKGIYQDKSFIYNGHPYEFGEAWLKEELPADVQEGIARLMEMPLEVEAA